MQIQGMPSYFSSHHLIAELSVAPYRKGFVLKQTDPCKVNTQSFYHPSQNASNALVFLQTGSDNFKVQDRMIDSIVEIYRTEE